MCELLGGVRFRFSCTDTQKWNYSIIDNCECNCVGNGKCFPKLPQSFMSSAALGAVSVCEIGSGISPWGIHTSRTTADPSPNTWDASVGLWLEPPVPSSSPFSPPLSLKLYQPLVSCFFLPLAAGPSSTTFFIANLGPGQPCVRSS